MKRKRPVLLGMAVHPPRLPATRLRLAQYVPYFEQVGFDCALWTFLHDRDLVWWHGNSTLRRIAVMLKAMSRIPTAVVLILRADVVVVQRECLPFGPPVLEWLSARWNTLIWDVDDFIWEPYVSPTAGRWTLWLRTSEKKHDRICRMASECWAGSDAIAEWMRRRTDAVWLVPSVLEVPKRRAALRDRTSTAAWVGSHSTVAFLDSVMPAVSRCRYLDKLIVVGGHMSYHGSTPVLEQEWSLQVERDICSSVRVGLYPVDRTNVYAEGKCGLKAVLYMAHGLPCVITPTRPNAAIIRHELEGLHAEGQDDWCAAVDRLLRDDELWERMSARAHQRALNSYSLETWGPRVANRLRDSCPACR